MFKKRTRPTSVRQKDFRHGPSLDTDTAPIASGSGSVDTDHLADQQISPSSGAAPSLGEEGEDGDSAAKIDDLILIRKLRKSKQGMDLERLNRGEEKGRKVVGASEKYGISSQKKKKEGDDE